MIVSRKMAEAAWRVMLSWMPDGLTENPPMPTTEEEVKVSYRTASKRAHPDGGGDPAAFAAVDRAKHVLLHWLERSKRDEPQTAGAGTECTRCAGTGHVESRRAWRSMRVQCPLCRGTGCLDAEHEKSND